MSGTESHVGLARRSLLARLGAGVAAFAAGASTTKAQSTASPWQPARHAQDDWLDEIAGGHRFVLDTTTAAGFRGAMQYANNYFMANESAYGLKDSDLAVVIMARHFSTVFGYTDAVWAKYGTELSQLIDFTDRETGQPPSVNVYASGGSVSLDGLAERGVHFAVCQMATRVFAGGITRRTGGDADAIYSELASNLIPNSHLVSAGIVTIARAQERGYAFSYTG